MTGSAEEGPARPRSLLIRPPGPVEPWQEQVVRELAGVSDLTVALGWPGTAGMLAADVIVNLGDELPTRAGRDVLTIRDEHDLGPGSLAARAVLQGQRSVIVRLIRIAPSGLRTILEEGALALSSWRWSVSRRSLLETVAAWPARALAGSTSLGAGRLWADPGRSAQAPRAWALRAAELRQAARRVVARLVEEQWAIGVVNASLQELVRGLPHDRVRWLDPPAGAFLADPMALPGDGPGLSLLAEAYWYHERRGKIVAVRAGRHDHHTSIVLERPWHLSYPFVFRHDGEIYCLPEMWRARRAQLFRADSFPDRWSEGPVLLEDFAAVDSTLHFDGERFWLFCTNRDDAPDMKLFLFHSGRLEGSWQPHPWNPVRCDLRNSRSAGPLFFGDGSWWRPAQDCSATYGGAVVINRVLELTPTRFREEAVTRLAPDPGGPYPDGLHTVCAAGPVTVIDGKRHVVAPGRVIGIVGAAWRRRTGRASVAPAVAGRFPSVAAGDEPDRRAMEGKQ